MNYLIDDVLDCCDELGITTDDIDDGILDILPEDHSTPMEPLELDNVLRGTNHE